MVNRNNNNAKTKHEIMKQITKEEIFEKKMQVIFIGNRY